MLYCLRSLKDGEKEKVGSARKSGFEIIEVNPDSAKRKGNGENYRKAGFRSAGKLTCDSSR